MLLCANRAEVTILNHRLIATCRWIFYLEGLFTALYGIVMFFVFPRSPAHSRFLTPEQKAHITRRLKLDSPAGVDDFEEKFSWAECKKAATSPHVILLFIALFGNGLTLCKLGPRTALVQNNALTEPSLDGFGYFTPCVGLERLQSYQGPANGQRILQDNRSNLRLFADPDAATYRPAFRLGVPPDHVQRLVV